MVEACVVQTQPGERHGTQAQGIAHPFEGDKCPCRPAVRPATIVLPKRADKRSAFLRGMIGVDESIWIDR